MLVHNIKNILSAPQQHQYPVGLYSHGNINIKEFLTECSKYYIPLL